MEQRTYTHADIEKTPCQPRSGHIGTYRHVCLFPLVVQILRPGGTGVEGRREGWLVGVLTIVYDRPISIQKGLNVPLGPSQCICRND
jgi:hypothetical protein